MARRSAVQRPRRGRRSELLSLLVAALFAATASAHPPPRATDVAAGPDGDRLAVRLERGLVLSDDGGASWRLRCAAGAGFGLAAEPAMAWAGGALLLATSQGLTRGADSCTAGAVRPELDGVAVSALAEAPDGVLWAATSQAGVENRLWRSDDGGERWTAVGATLVDTFLGGLAPVGGDRLFAVGVRLDDSGGIEHFLHRSDDAGASWVGGPVALFDEEHRLVLLGAADGAAYVAVRSYDSAGGEDRLVRGGGDGAVEELIRLPGLSGLAEAGDGALVLSSAAGLHRAEDGRTFVPVGGLDRPLGCMRRHGDDLLLCGERHLDHFGLARLTPAGELEELMAWRDVAAPLPCEDRTCDDDWADWVVEIEPDPPLPARSDGGGCATAPRSPGFIVRR